MTPYLSDPDVTLYHGDVLTTLRTLEAESIDCVVTSPPYWGLRDYGTGSWEGGADDCDHLGPPMKTKAKINQNWDGDRDMKNAAGREPMGEICSKCGARRIDHQLGLEPTPEQYVENMVEVFREVRRVLAPHGTCWLNLGDSYVSTAGSLRTIAAGGKAFEALNEEGADGRLLNSQRQRYGRADRGVLKAKDLVGIPWRVAFALQADGWYLRSDIIWAKPNPMPESVTDRPTKAHEYLFLLSKQPRYFFDQEAVREPAEWARWGDQTTPKYNGTDTTSGWIKPKSKEELQRRNPTWEERKAAGATRGNLAFGDNVGAGTQRGVHGEGVSHDLGDPGRGRNVRSVWEIATQPYPEAHFATFPEELARRCITAGCPEQVCRECGKPRERVVNQRSVSADNPRDYQGVPVQQANRTGKQEPKKLGAVGTPTVETLGFTDCGHGDYRPGVALDPFIGSGTTCYVARKLGRHSIGIDLNTEYLDLAARRLQQQSLFALPRP